eukprot:35403_1
MADESELNDYIKATAATLARQYLQDDDMVQVEAPHGQTKTDIDDASFNAILRDFDELLDTETANKLERVGTMQLINAAKEAKSKITPRSRYFHKHFGRLQNGKFYQLFTEPQTEEEGTLVQSVIDEFHGIMRFAREQTGDSMPMRFAREQTGDSRRMGPIPMGPDMLALEFSESKSNSRHSELQELPKKKRSKYRGLRQRVVFVAANVKRIYNINTDDETFNCDMVLSLTWLATKFDIKSFHSWANAAIQPNGDDAGNLWTPSWIPELVFPNSVQQDMHYLGFEISLGNGPLLQYGGGWNPDIDLGFKPNNAYWIRGTLQASLMLSEELELEGFPFDCQDFRIFIRGKTGHKVCDILPFPSAATPTLSFDTGESVFGQFNLDATYVGFDLTHPIESQKLLTYPQITLYFKCHRKWQIYRVYWVIPLLMMLLGLITFVFSADDVPTNSSWGITLLLADIATLQFINSELPSLPFDTVIDRHTLHCFYYLVFVTIWRIGIGRAINIYQDREAEGTVETLFYVDYVAAFIAFVLFIVINWKHWTRSKTIQGNEQQKLKLDSSELQKWFENNHYIQARQYLGVNFKSIFDNFKSQKCSDEEIMTQALKVGRFASMMPATMEIEDEYVRMKNKIDRTKNERITFANFWMPGGQAQPR